jgi:hypothetical protein
VADRTEEGKPKRKGRPRTSEIPRIDVVVSEETRELFDALLDSVRAANYTRPSPPTLISALIYNETRRGKALEEKLLMPFRKAHPEAD